MKYLACLALAMLITGMLVDEYAPSYGLPMLTVSFLALIGVWSCFEDLVKKLERSL